jgi:hypothetical protein
MITDTIHMKVHSGGTLTSSGYSGGTTSRTAQFFLNDTQTDEVAKIYPYSTHTITRTLNSEDNIYLSQSGSLLQLRKC